MTWQQTQWMGFPFKTFTQLRNSDKKYNMQRCWGYWGHEHQCKRASSSNYVTLPFSNNCILFKNFMLVKKNCLKLDLNSWKNRLYKFYLI